MKVKHTKKDAGEVLIKLECVTLELLLQKPHLNFENDDSRLAVKMLFC
jgi:hypothetical protein